MLGMTASDPYEAENTSWVILTLKREKTDGSVSCVNNGEMCAVFHPSVFLCKRSTPERVDSHEDGPGRHAKSENDHFSHRIHFFSFPG